MNLKVSVPDLWRRAHKLYFIGEEERVLIKSSISKEEAIALIEAEARKYFKTKYAVFTPSGRAALELALRAIELKMEDEVVTQAFQCHEIPFLLNKICTVRYADVEKNSFNMSAENVAKTLTKKTRAIIPVNLYGFIKDTPKIAKLCKKKRITLIEDCAHSIGSRIGKKKSGTYGDVAIFSFCKSLAGPAGGLLITNRKEIFERAREVLSRMEKNPSKISGLLERKLVFNMTSLREMQNKFPFSLVAEKMQRDSRGKDYHVGLTREEVCVCLAQFKKIDEIIENYVSRYKEFYDLMKKIKGIKLFPYQKGMNCLRFPIMFNKDVDVEEILADLYREGAFEPSLNYRKDYHQVRGLDRMQRNSEDTSEKLIVVALDNLKTKDLVELKNRILEKING